MNFYKTFLFVILIVAGFSLKAQPGGGRPCPRPPCPPPPTPISGIEYLIGLGGLYGLKKIVGRPKIKK